MAERNLAAKYYYTVRHSLRAYRPYWDRLKTSKVNSIPVTQPFVLSRVKMVKQR